MHYLCLRSCLEVVRPEAVMFHYEEEPWGPLWDEIKPAIRLRPISSSLRLPQLEYAAGSASSAYRYAHTSDFLRVAILQEEGGVYADMDTLFVRPFPAHLYENDYVMGHERVDPLVPAAAVGGSLCNALLMAKAGSEFGHLWQNAMHGEFDGSWSRHSTFLPYKLSQTHPLLIHVEPESSFFYLDWTAHGIERLFSREETLPASVCSLHLWSHLWWDASRTDVSRFHQGRLTGEYVACARSTYARYARPFLPKQLSASSRARWRFTVGRQLLEDTAARLRESAQNRLRPGGSASA